MVCACLPGVSVGSRKVDPSGTARGACLRERCRRQQGRTEAPQQGRKRSLTPNRRFGSWGRDHHNAKRQGPCNLMYMTKADEGHGPKPKKYMVYNETQETSGLYHCVFSYKSISLCSLTWVLLSCRRRLQALMHTPDDHCALTSAFALWFLAGEVHRYRYRCLPPVSGVVHLSLMFRVVRRPRPAGGAN